MSMSTLGVFRLFSRLKFGVNEINNQLIYR